jgi:peptidoglycan/xylan/chitin deacetylase (PgdA/CDA1 family)
VSDLLVLRYRAVAQGGQSCQAVSPRQLERQLGVLLARGYRAETFTDAVLSRPTTATFSVTFDDARRSVFEHGLPRLEALGLRATVFVPTGLVGADRAHPDPVMSWDELGQLRDAGWEIGAQTESNCALSALDDRRLQDELANSRAACEARLGVDCRALAYPQGATDTRVMAAVLAAGYVAAAGLPLHRPHVPLPLNWPRLEVSARDSRLRFAVRTSHLAEKLRRFPVLDPPPTPLTVPAPEDKRVPVVATPARIAVIVPCFNDGQLVVEAVNSIAEPEPVELVIVNDASSDPDTLQTLDALRGRGIRVVDHEVNRGLSAARMSGLRATAARYVFPLDADDLAVPGALTTMADRLDESPDVTVCFGDYAMFGTGQGVRRVPARLDPYRVAYRNDYPVSSLFRRSVLESVGAWQAVGRGTGYEDWSLWMTLAERGAQGVHSERGVAFRRRLHGSRMLGDAAKHHVELYATLRTLHPRLYEELPRHRRETDLGFAAKWLYPILFGWRPPLGLVTRVERILRRSGG